MLTGLADWPAAHAALLMAFLQETVLAVGWLVVAALQRELRRAAWHWAGFALLSGVSFVAYVAAAHLQQDGLRLLGNMQMVCAMLLQCRGLYVFADQRPRDGVSVAIAALTVCALFLWSSTEDAPWRIAAVSFLMAGCSAWAAVTVLRIARGFTDAGWIPALFAAPMALGGLVLAVRAAGALVTPETIVAATAAGSSTIALAHSPSRDRSDPPATTRGMWRRSAQRAPSSAASVTAAAVFDWIMTATATSPASSGQ